MVLTFKQSSFVIGHYFATKSLVYQEAFQEVFPKKIVLYKVYVHRLIRKFYYSDSVCNQKHNLVLFNNDTLRDVRLSLL
jgi:hypothetical protein